MRLHKPYYLLVRPPESDAEVEFGRFVHRYKHTLRRMGGYWMASWFVPIQDGVDGRYLESWFKDRLGHTVIERTAGIVTWRGIVWSMDLTLDGWRERKDLGEVWNAIRTVYTDEDGVERSTEWYTNETSINRFGRREFILTMDEVVHEAAAAAAQTMLVESAEPWPRPIGFGSRLEDGLEVTAVGEVFTANNRFVTVADDEIVTVSTYIHNLISLDCEFLTPGNIIPNTVLVRRSFPQPIRVWDALSHLAAIGDGSYPYVLEVDAHGYMHYRRANPEPAYLWNGRRLGLTTRGGTQSPWAMRPGVLRNTTRPKTTTIPGSFLSDGRDTWIAEIEMADGQETPHLKTEQYDDAEIERAMEQARRWLEELEDEGTGDGGLRGISPAPDRRGI